MCTCVRVISSSSQLLSSYLRLLDPTVPASSAWAASSQKKTHSTQRREEEAEDGSKDGDDDEEQDEEEEEEEEGDGDSLAKLGLNEHSTFGQDKLKLHAYQTQGTHARYWHVL